MDSASWAIIPAFVCTSQGVQLISSVAPSALLCNRQANTRELLQIGPSARVVPGILRAAHAEAQRSNLYERCTRNRPRLDHPRGLRLDAPPARRRLFV